MKKRVLIGSCGGLTGIYISKYLKKNYKEFEVIGFDTKPKFVMREYFDDLIEFPLISDKNFLKKLECVVKELKIDLYIPTLSKEIRRISENISRVEKIVKVIVSPIESIRILEDKINYINELDKIEVTVPRIYTLKNLNEIKYPVFLKPRIGSGSKGTKIIRNEAELINNSDRDTLISEYLRGKEFTIDCYFDTNGALITYNQRIREKTLGGAVIVTQNDFSVDFSTIIRKVAAHYTIKGPANFQFFLTNDNRRVLTDINLRFASGGLPLSIESGADTVKLLLSDLLGEKYQEEKYVSDKKFRRMIRSFEERFYT